ncbi:MAG TPA: mechanosensitive ion channel family protein [Proteobacteria bacterium]|nr:low conductance mechanosensitive channel YnaI [bacterium BMS3Abin14]HDL54242.1 mechanosensitive ion channel family protein [Pseudomonadota bacterium]
MSNYFSVFETIVLGNSIWRWLTAGVVLVIVYIALRLCVKVVARYLGKLAERTESTLDDFIVDLLKARTKHLFFFVFALYAATLALSLPGRIALLITDAAIISIALQVGLWGNGVVNYFISRRASRDENKQLNLEAYSVITVIARAVLWTAILLLALQHLGVKVTALVAGLGVSGIAVALAVQNILGDLFASLSIVFDRPFVIGDFIVVGDLAGTVEHVGLKTTRLRSLSGEQLIFSNNDLLSSRIQNYRRMNERRVVFSLGVTYQTTAGNLEAIPGWIRDIIQSQEKVRFDRAHFKTYGDFSLNYEVVYYVLGRDYALYMDIQQDLNLAIFRKFEEKGVEFAYPTQTVFVEKS